MFIFLSCIFITIFALCLLVMTKHSSRDARCLFNIPRYRQISETATAHSVLTSGRFILDEMCYKKRKTTSCLDVSCTRNYLLCKIDANILTVRFLIIRRSPKIVKYCSAVNKDGIQNLAIT